MSDRTSIGTPEDRPAAWGIGRSLSTLRTHGALQLTANIRHGCSLAWIIGRDGPYPGRAVFVTHERIVSIDLAGKSRPALG